ncbi:hypothetical protein HBB16_21160 [Pseudonocardia sp. MCCB 268]|nr:hypothetical protein [Pseudonocardia cytotoxica]
MPDPLDPAVTGFHRVLARDGAEGRHCRTCAGPPRPCAGPGGGVVLAPGQRSTATAATTTRLHAVLRQYYATSTPPPGALDTRVDPRD